MSTEYHKTETPSNWTSANCGGLFDRPALLSTQAGKNFYDLKCQPHLWKHVVQTHFSNVGDEMMNYEGVTHSSWVRQVNGAQPDIRVGLDSTWRDEVGGMHKTVKTAFEFYADGESLQVREAGTILANSLAFDAEAQSVMDRNKEAWHKASEGLLNILEKAGQVGECGGCMFDGTATKGEGESIILDLPTIDNISLSGSKRQQTGLLVRFTEDGMSDYNPTSRS